MAFVLATPALPFSNNGAIRDCLQTKMSQYEIEVLYTCKEDLLRNLDAQNVTRFLHNRGFIPDTLHDELRHSAHAQIHAPRTGEILISYLPFLVNFIDLVELLYEIGYRDIAAKIYLQLLKGRNDGLALVRKSRSGQRPVVHKFFRGLKRKVHDAQFKNPRLFLRQLANRYAEKMCSEADPVKQQLLADKCIAIIGAEIDAIAITFDSNLRNHDAFGQMKDLITNSSNSAIADVVYFGRLANANSIIGNFDDSEDMLVAARCKAYNTGPCLELVNMLYIEVYVKLWQFEHAPSESLRRSLLVWGRVGLASLEEEDPDTEILWRRMFILRMVFCLIGLGNRANVIDNCSVDEECMTEAEDLLADIDRHWYGIEARRKMFYYVAKARLCDLNWQRTSRARFLSDCLEFLRKARKIARDGHFEELKFIVKFFEQTVTSMRQNNQRLLREPSGDTLEIGNHVLLTSDDDSVFCASVSGIDETRNFVLLQVHSSDEEQQNLRIKFHQRGQDSENEPSGRDNNLMLLKSIEVLSSSGASRTNCSNLSTNHTSQTQCCNPGNILLWSTKDGSLLPLSHRSESFAPGPIGEHLNLERIELLKQYDSKTIPHCCNNPSGIYVVTHADFTVVYNESGESFNFVNLRSGSDTVSLPRQDESQGFLPLVYQPYDETGRDRNSPEETIRDRIPIDNAPITPMDNSRPSNLDNLEVWDHRDLNANIAGGEPKVVDQICLEAQVEGIPEHSDDAMLLKVDSIESTDAKLVHDTAPLIQPNLMDILKENTYGEEEMLGHVTEDAEGVRESFSSTNQLEAMDCEVHEHLKGNIGACQERPGHDDERSVKLHLEIDNRHFVSHDRLRTMSTSDYNLLLPAEQIKEHHGDPALNAGDDQKPGE